MTDLHSPSMHIRQTTPQDASLLTMLAFRSKQYWGYSSEFMEASQPDLTIRPEFIMANPVFVLEESRRIVGFYSLRDKENNIVTLEHFFVEPDRIGQGYGQCLWQHAIATTQDAGFQKMFIEADPNAEGFYKRMGAVRIGEVPSIVARIIPGRVLPLLEFIW